MTCRSPLRYAESSSTENAEGHAGHRRAQIGFHCRPLFRYGFNWFLCASCLIVFPRAAFFEFKITAMFDCIFLFFAPDPDSGLSGKIDRNCDGKCGHSYVSGHHAPKTGETLFLDPKSRPQPPPFVSPPVRIFVGKYYRGNYLLKVWRALRSPNLRGGTPPLIRVRFASKFVSSD